MPHAIYRLGAKVKRLVDIIIALVLLPFAAPIIAVLAVAIRLESAGSPIYRQTRVGQWGEPFVLLKLRTMYRDTIEGPSHELSATKITRIGKILRFTKFDELPQLWLVLMGKMSFVGPRPCLPTQLVLIEERRKRGVLNLKPGITGISQLAGIDMAHPERLAETDAFYIDKQGALFDLGLILRTGLGRGSGDSVK
jgi:O-antigen biosynthesis protein WbqP